MCEMGILGGVIVRVIVLWRKSCILEPALQHFDEKTALKLRIPDRVIVRVIVGVIKKKKLFSF